MKKMLLAVPFIVSLAAAMTLLVARGARVESVCGIAFMVSSFACFLAVPVLSKKSLILGYGAVLFPFVMFGLLSVLSPHEVTTSVTSSGHIEWTETRSAEDIIRELKAKSREPIQPSETTRGK